MAKRSRSRATVRRFEPAGASEISLSFVDYPIMQRLKMDAGAIRKKVGKRVQKRVRARLKKGLQDAGVPLPNTKRGGRPVLNDTGRLIRSVKFDGNRDVGPSGARRDGHASTNQARNRNAAIMNIQIYTLDIDPLASTDFNVEAHDLAAEEIQKQIDSGKFNFLTEYKRISGK